MGNTKGLNETERYWLKKAKSRTSNDWEASFISDIRRKNLPLTKRQKEIVKRIAGVKTKEIQRETVTAPSAIAHGVRENQLITSRKWRKNTKLPKWN